MHSQSSHGAAKCVIALLCMVHILLLLWPVAVWAELAGMRNYCIAPSMPGTGVKPNLMLMIDNSASMYDPAYTDPANHCLDDSYDDTASYQGYFDQDTLYSYTSKTVAKNEEGYFVVAPPTKTIASSSCNTGKSSFLCVNVSAGKVNLFLASGRFLNWLAMSKLDLEKLVLTGGKIDTGGMLQSESRGCQGKKFIKMVGSLPVTFAVRGPLPARSSKTGASIPAESDYVYRAGFGGMTRIDIYPGRYKKEECMGAVKQWQEGTLQSLKSAALACLGQEFDPPPANIPSKGRVFTEIMSDCYSYLVKKEAIFYDEQLVEDCGARIKNKYLDIAKKIPQNNGDDVCAAGIYHTVNGGAGSRGYLGECYKSPGFDPPSCVLDQIKAYCDGITNPTLTDASALESSAVANANVPGFILDGGVSSLGSAVGTLIPRFTPPVPQPKGLIQEFAADINFGAMVFQDNGAGSECSNDPGAAIPCVKHCQLDAVKKECYQDSDCLNVVAGACQEDPHTDGGKIIAPLGDPVGSHNIAGTPGSGLVAAIDQVTANSWTPLAESFYDAMQHFGDEARFQSQPSCQKNNVLIVTDGVSTADRSQAVNNLVAQAWGKDGMPASKRTPDDNGATPDPLPFLGSYNLDDLAWIARNKKLDGSGPILQAKDYLSSFVVYTGLSCGDYQPDGSCTTSDEGVPEKMMQLVTAKGGGTFASVKKSGDQEKAIRWILQQVATGSGAEPSLLATGDGNGAIFLQEQFYTIKSFDGGRSSASWIGEMQSLWYYIDPFIGNVSGGGSAIREDTLDQQKLDLKNDRIVNLRFDPANNRTYAYLTGDDDGDGVGDGAETKLDVDQVKSLWRAGQKLWARDLSDSPRTIYTALLPGGSEVTGTGLMKFDWNVPGVVKPYLNLQTGGPEAQKLIKYVHGFDYPGDSSMRNRTLWIGGVPQDRNDPRDKGVGVWKLGDIVSSTPQMQSSVPLGAYHLPAPKGYNDETYLGFIGTDEDPYKYRERGMVYVGANDGMLHAFKLGKLDSGSSETPKATLAGTDLGKEQWGFIPKNALPYLKYLSDPNYRHLFYVDGRINLVDASIAGCGADDYWSCPKSADSWRTVLIGAMGLGGASCTAGSNCVPTPLADPANPGAGFGYSSYFALDVTDPARPTLLWEFSHPALGFSTSGPAVVRIGGAKVNGRWFAVFGSGPTGPIDSSTNQFKGRSNQNLRFFIVDLRTGALLHTIDTGIAEAFAGSMAGGGIDADKWKPGHPGNYQDDAIYLGYTKKSAVTGAWTDGGVIRILTQESLYPTGSKPWSWSKVIEGTGPVTAGIAKLQDRHPQRHNLWLYFGAGRYFFPQDDMSTQRSLYGVKDPCYNYKPMGVDRKLDSIEPTCSETVSAGTLVDQSGSVKPVDAGHTGWRIDLDRADGGIGAERVVTNPNSMTGGVVFFSTFQPNTEPCQLDRSYLWGVKYDTGGAVADGTLQGKVLIRLATGSLQDTGLSGNLLEKGGRRSAPMAGKAGGMKVVSNSGLKPLKRILHIQER